MTFAVELILEFAVAYKVTLPETPLTFAVISIGSPDALLDTEPYIVM